MIEEYPVGRCDSEQCHYQERHRHGFDCDKSCACGGVGAVTEPLSEGDLVECDWGYCNRPSVAIRVENGTVDEFSERDEVWLAVCSWHAGWEDYPPTEPGLNHEFLPVAGHPDDDECTHRSDGTDETYCGEPEVAHQPHDPDIKCFDCGMLSPHRAIEGAIRAGWEIDRDEPANALCAQCIADDAEPTVRPAAQPSEPGSAFPPVPQSSQNPCRTDQGNSNHDVNPGGGNRKSQNPVPQRKGRSRLPPGDGLDTSKGNQKMSNHKIEMDYSLEAGHTAKCVCGCDIEPVNADNSRDALLTLQVNLGLLSPDHVDQQP